MKSRRFLRRYISVRKFLINHPATADFLSHGAVHIIGAIAVLAFGLFCYNKTNGYDPEVRQINIDLDASGQRLNFMQLDMGFHENIKKTYGEREFLNLYAGYKDHDQVKGNENYNGAIGLSNGKLKHIFGGREGEVVDVEIGNLHIDSLSNRFIKLSSTDKSDAVLCASVCGDLFTNDEKNPYYYFCIKIDSGPLFGSDTISGRTNIYFGGEDVNDIAKNPVKLINVSPSNYTYHPNEGLYFSSEDVIKNGGIYIIAEDINKMNAVQRNIFLYTILVGAALAFFIDIIIDLVVKWKSLADKHKRKTN